MTSWDDFQVSELPEMSLNGMKVERFVVTEEEANVEMLRSMFSSSRGRRITEGAYTRLLVDGELWMSDTRDEICDQYNLFNAVRQVPNPTVLLHGLGLGVTVKGAFLNGASHVTVVELDQRVIDSVGSFWSGVYGNRLEIIQGDALTWKPPKSRRWNIVWHDIWPTICKENAKDMSTLHRRFARRCDWQGSWCRHRVKQLQRESREYERVWPR